MLKLTILGAGTDASNIPKIPNRYPPGYLVEWAGEKLLFECSEGIRFRLEQTGIDYTSIQHLAISHSHPDHYALPQFYQSMWNSLQWSGRGKKQRILNIYCPDQIAREFWQLWRFYQASWPDGLPQPKLNFIVLPQTGSVNIDLAKLTGFSVHHGFGKVGALAFRLERARKIFAYSGDSGVCEGIKEAAQEADIFVCEAVAAVGDHKAATNYGHLSPFDVGTIAREAGVKKVVMVHYTGRDSGEAMVADCRASGFEGEIVVGKDFQEFEI